MSLTRIGSRKLAEDSAENDASQQSVGSDAIIAAGATAGPIAAADVPPTAGTPTASAKAKAARKVKFPCGKCDAEVSCGVACNSCDVWFHDKCIDGMTKEYFDNCKKAHELFGFTAFLCKICRKVFNTVNKALKEVKSDLKAMQDRVMVLVKEKEVLAQKLEKIEKGTEKVTERVEGVAREVVTGMEKAKEEVKKDVKTEMTMREANSSNIAIYGLEETKEEEEGKWREGEMKKVMEITGQMGVQINGEITIKNRAGRPREDAKPRPLIVKVADDETRARIFQNAPRLSREEKTRRVFISHDLTWQQREEARKEEAALREEAAKQTEQAKKGKKRVRFIVVGARGRRRIVEKAIEEEEVSEV